MKAKLSLTTRAFLFAFIPMCLVVVACFLTINTAIERKIKADLKESLHGTEKALASARAGYDRRNRQQLAILSENAELKTQIVLFQEVPYGQRPRPQLRQTLEAQLRELGSHLDYDLLLVADWQGRPIGGISGNDGREIPLDGLSIESESSFLYVQGTPSETITVSVPLGAENRGSLTGGKQCDLSALSHLGEASALECSVEHPRGVPQQVLKAKGRRVLLLLLLQRLEAEAHQESRVVDEAVAAGAAERRGEPDGSRRPVAARPRGVPERP